MVDDDALEVIRQAERIVWAASWHLQEQTALEHLAGTCGLARARLEPRSEVIQLVTYDGEHLGHVRREGPHGPGERPSRAPPRISSRPRHLLVVRSR